VGNGANFELSCNGSMHFGLITGAVRSVGGGGVSGDQLEESCKNSQSVI